MQLDRFESEQISRGDKKDMEEFRNIYEEVIKELKTLVVNEDEDEDHNEDEDEVTGKKLIEQLTTYNAILDEKNASYWQMVLTAKEEIGKLKSDNYELSQENKKLKMMNNKVKQLLNEEKEKRRSDIEEQQVQEAKTKSLFEEIEKLKETISRQKEMIEKLVNSGNIECQAQRSGPLISPERDEQMEGEHPAEDSFEHQHEPQAARTPQQGHTAEDSSEHQDEPSPSFAFENAASVELTPNQPAQNQPEQSSPCLAIVQYSMLGRLKEREDRVRKVDDIYEYNFEPRKKKKAARKDVPELPHKTRKIKTRAEKGKGKSEQPNFDLDLDLTQEDDDLTQEGDTDLTLQAAKRPNLENIKWSKYPVFKLLNERVQQLLIEFWTNAPHRYYCIFMLNFKTPDCHCKAVTIA